MRTRSQSRRLEQQQSNNELDASQSNTTNTMINQNHNANNTNNNQRNSQKSHMISSSTSNTRLESNMHRTLEASTHRARNNMKNQIKKATLKFERACKQLIQIDQKINDLQNSYTSAIQTDRKTFKIVYRMQLATLEGTHEAYIEYIERKVEEIRQLKRKLFGESPLEHLSTHLYDNITPIQV